MKPFTDACLNLSRRHWYEGPTQDTEISPDPNEISLGGSWVTTSGALTMDLEENWIGDLAPFGVANFPSGQT